MANKTEFSCSEDATARLSAGSGEAGDASSVMFGIIIGLLASVGINLGQNIQNTNADDPAKAGAWWFGFVLFLLSAIANFVAFAFAPASLLAPLEGAQFVTNFAYGLVTKNKVLYNSEAKHGDKSGWRTKAVLRTGLGTSLVVVGITLPITVAPSEVAVFDEGAIWCFWRGTAWWIYFVGTSVLALSCFLLYRMVRPTVLQKNTVAEREINVRPKEGSFWNRYCGKRVTETKYYFEIKDIPCNHKHNKVHMALFAIPSAILGAFAVVQAKAISELVEPIFIDGEVSVLVRWLFWQCLLFIIAGLGPWFWILNQAPYYYEVLAILPLMQGCYIIFSSIGGGIFFEEFETFTDVQAVMFACGLSLIVTGMWFIIPEKPVNYEKEPLITTIVAVGLFMPVVLYPVDRRASMCAGQKTVVKTRPQMPLLKFIQVTSSE